MGLKAKYPRYEIICFDNLRRRGSELNVPRLKGSGVNFVHGDIRCPEDFDGIGPVSAVIECSAEPSVLAGIDSSPAALVQHNLIGTVNCLDFARKFKSDFIFLSTSRVYPIAALEKLRFTEKNTRFVLGDFQDYPGVSAAGISERFPLDGSRSLYGATKLASEHIVEEYRAFFGLKTVVNRCGVVAGPWQMGKVDQGFMALWVASHIWKKPLSYIGYGGEGKQVRDVLHVNDLLKLIDYELHNMNKLSGAVLNAGGGADRSVSLLELTALCQKISGNKIAIRREPKTRKADVRMYLTDNSRATELTGWQPKLSVETLVKDVYDWMKRHERQLEPVFR
jgi:CDP-paratose 2-epimerase